MNQRPSNRRQDGQNAPWTGPRGFRWRLVGPPGPPMTLALVLGEAVRALVFRHAGLRGLMPLPLAFHGGPEGKHTHAHWLAEDEDGDGLADHMLLFAAAGLPPTLLPVLAEGGMLALRLADGHRLPTPGTSWRLAPDWMGSEGPAYLFGPAREWWSVTPFVTPQWRSRGGPLRAGAEESLRPGRDVPAQICRELAVRGLPEPEVVTLEPGSSQAAGWIGIGGVGRSRTDRTPPGDAVGVYGRLRFADAVAGPLALGYGAHFGIGLFVCATHHLHKGQQLQSDVPLRVPATIDKLLHVHRARSLFQVKAG